MGTSPSQVVTPDEWARTLSAPPVVTSDPGAWSRALLRRWRDVAADMEQPPLDHHQIVLHLGGAKRVRRRGDGAEIIAEVEAGDLTFNSAGTAHTWATEGPIDFAHLYVQPSVMNRFAAVEFERDGVEVELADAVGRSDPTLAALLHGMMDELPAGDAAPRLLLDALLNATLMKLLRDHSTLQKRRAGQQMLSPRRLRRVLDFIEAHLETDIALDDLARVAGSSPYRFGQAFRSATGCTPYAYVIDQRIQRAKTLLRDSLEPITEVAWRCGFKSPTQFATIFRRRIGVSPRRFRQDW